MKKSHLLFVSMCLCLTLCACAFMEKSVSSKSTVFSAADYPIQVTCPYGWWQKEESNFDLQCKSMDSVIVMSIFCYYDIDLPEDVTRQEFFESQNQSLLNKRENVNLVEEMTEWQYEDKDITSVLYSAEYKDGKYYYYMSLVSFNRSDCFAWVIFNGIPSEINGSRDTIDGILKTVALIVE